MGHLVNNVPNIGGPVQNKRSLLMSVVNSKIYYATHTWAKKGTKYMVNCNAMNHDLRTAAIRTIREYRMVSAEADGHIEFYRICGPEDIPSYDEAPALYISLHEASAR